MENNAEVHNSLEVLHPGVLPLEESLELEVGLGLVEEDDLDVDVVPRRVEEVGEEGAHRLVVDVAAHHDELTPVRLVVARVSVRDGEMFVRTDLDG